MTPTPHGLRLALLGSRGIPGRYGGYETFYDELATRLAARGHRVTVYCRPAYTPCGLTTYRGVELVVLPTLATKHLDTPVHTFLSAFHASRRGFDAALVVNSANALFVPLLTQAGIPTALHVDGIEKRRAKWGPVGRAVYAVSERLACMLPSHLVTDADVIHDYYLERHGAPSTAIAYGVDPQPPEETGVLERLGLEPRGYFLYVSRFEPENNPHRVAEGYRRVGGDLPLVMVGDAPYAREFIASFRDDADPRIVFPGAIYGDGYRELLSHALAYVHATEVGGTHPALVEAMGYGNAVVVHDTPENREVAGSAGAFFDVKSPATLGRTLERLRTHPEEAAHRRRAAAARAERRYSWERVTERYEELFGEMIRV
jgi:glycosyltransferase involved in cell wall biosynthesis